MAGIRTQFNGVDAEEILADIKQGVEANLGKSQTLSMAGVPTSKADLLAAVAAKQKPFDDVEAGRNEVERLIKVRDGGLEGVLDFIKTFDGGLVALVGTDPNVKAKYGIPKPAAKRQLTSEETMKKVAKMHATRTLRGTLGKRQKEQIKATGDFTVSVAPSDPASQPSAPAPVAITPAAPSAGAVAVNGAPTAAPFSNGTASNGVAPALLMNGAGH